MHNGVVVGAMMGMALWMASGIAAAQGDVEKGKASYSQYCASCHGAAGKGNGAAAAALNPKPRDLTDKDYVAKMTDDYLANVINKGGAGVGKSALMPPWEGVLKSDDVKNVIAFIRTLSQ